MEVATVTSTAANVDIKPSSIKAAQEKIGRLDVLVCGECHTVFHFIQDFQEHRSKDGACTKTSNFRENNNIEQKAQVWAFLLWKDTQLGQIEQDSPDKDNSSSWKLYQKWCKMDTHTRDGWITAGKTIQTFTKISNVKMQDVPQGGMTEGGKTVVLRKVIRNGQPDSPDKKDLKSDLKVKNEPGDHRNEAKLLKSPLKSKDKSLEDDENNDSDDDYYVEQIMAKRFNPKRKVYEYLLKWRKRNSLINKDNYSTWEDVLHVSQTYKNLMNDFETNLAKQKEIKAQQVAKSINKANQLGLGQKNIKVESPKVGSNNTVQAGRPMRLSKSKATDRVKQWCGSMRDDELLGNKRKFASSDSDSDDVGIGTNKRIKGDTSGGEDDWVADSDEDKTLIGRSDVIQRAFRGATIQSNGSNRDLSNNMLNSNKNIIKIEQKHGSSPQPQSNVYIVHKKEGIIKLDSTPTNKIAVKGPNQSTSGGNVMLLQNRDSPTVVRKQIVTTNTQSNSITPVKVMTKADGTQVVTQMKVVQKTSAAKQAAMKNEPIKIQPKPDPNQQLQQIHLVATIPNALGIQQQRVVTNTSTLRTAVSSQRVDNSQRPLLPRPTPMGRSSLPSSNTGIVSITQSRTPARGQQRQLTSVSTPVQQQRPVVQKRVMPGSAPLSTLMQVSSNQTSVKPKITVVSNQAKVGNKTLMSPIMHQQQQQMKVSPRTTPVSKSQQAATPHQKMMMARKKLAAEAGVVPKPVGRTGATKASGQVRKIGAAGSAAQQANKPKESKLAETDGLHMEFHEVDSESSSDGEPDFPPLPAEGAQPCPDPESPPRQLTLCPLTGRLIGPDGEPVEQPEPEQPQPPAPTPMAIVPASAAIASGTTTISADGIITTTASGETAELVLPNLDAISETSGGIVRVEMSPGGTTGIVVQTSEAPTTSVTNVVMPGPDMPSLDDTSVEIQTTSSGEVVVSVPPIPVSEPTPVVVSTELPTVTSTEANAESVLPEPLGQITEQQPTTSEAEAIVTTKQETNTGAEIVVATDPTTGNVKLEENAGLVTITGEDGVVYQVAGQAEDGQTLLVTRGADGEQQCVYVTTEQAAGEEGSVLTLDHAVAEAVAQFMPDQVNIGSTQFYVKEDTAEETVEASVANDENQQLVVYNTNQATIDDSDNQVVAQVVSAEPPTEGGVRKVVLLLPDGNLMMTEVDEEQYAALELDK